MPLLAQVAQCPGFRRFIGAAPSSHSCSNGVQPLFATTAATMASGDVTNMIAEYQQFLDNIIQLLRIIEPRWTDNDTRACKGAVRDMMCNMLFPPCDVGCGVPLACEHMCADVTATCFKYVDGASWLRQALPNGKLRGQSQFEQIIKLPVAQAACDQMAYSMLACNYDVKHKDICDARAPQQ